MLITRSFCFNRIRCNSRSVFNFYQKRCYSYEGDGKTSVSFLNRETNDLMMINSFSRLGFRLNSGLFVVGPIILFPKTILSWNVAGDDDINEDSLSLFYHLEPPVDVLVIGLSDDDSFKKQNIFLNKFKALKQTKLNFELLTTEKAVATYNFLCIENRFVAAALIPPLKVDEKNADVFSDDFEKVLSKGKDDYMFGDDQEEVNKLEMQEEKKYQAVPDEKKEKTFKDLFWRDDSKIKKDK